MVAQHPCPTCGRMVDLGSEHRPASAPFCSERCRGGDLGDWLSERHRVSRPLNEIDLDEAGVDLDALAEDHLR